jgi:uncharacterized protein (DUF58 family)
MQFRAASRQTLVRPGGMFFFILVLALGAIGMLAGLNLLVFVFALLVAAILSGGLQSGPMMLGFQAAPESIPLLRAGAQVRIPVMIHQRSGGDALAIELSGTIVSDRGERELVDTRVGHLAPRATRLVYLPWIPLNRGLHTWSRLQAESGFPFGLLGKRVRWKVDRELVVRPRHFDLPPQILRALGSRGLGETSRRQTGDDGEPLGIRGWRLGDRRSDIAARATLRHGVLLSRQRGRIHPPRILIRLDLRGASPDMMERAISLAATILTHRERRGERVRLDIVGEGVGYEGVREGEEALAKIPKSGPRRGLSAIASQMEEGVLTIDTSDVWDPTKGHLGAASSDLVGVDG